MPVSPPAASNGGRDRRRLRLSRARKVGLPPGTPVYVGRAHDSPVALSVIEFDDDDFHELPAASVDDCVAFADSERVTWITVNGIHDAAAIEIIGQAFGLHPLTIEDVVSLDQRPKMEDYGSYVYLVLKGLDADGPEPLCLRQVSLVLGERFVLCFEESGGDLFEPVRTALRGSVGLVRTMGPDYLVYRLIDLLVDRFFPVIEELDRQQDRIEGEIIDQPESHDLRELHLRKGQLLRLRRAIRPLRDTLGALERSKAAWVTDRTRLFLRDVYDHAVELVDLLEAMLDEAVNLQDLLLNASSRRMNEIMKTLTVISTVILPMTFLVGVWGMNFAYMPELAQPWGYAAAWMVLLGVGGAMTWWLRRRRWL